MERLKGKVALVTGASSGLGRAIATRFTAEGARVILADIAADAGERAAAEIGGQARFARLDVTSQQNWTDLLSGIEQREARLDILVNSAGVSATGNIETTQLDVWQRGFKINCDGLFLGCHLAIPLLKRDRAPGSSIINLGSAAGIKPVAEYLGYGATKAAVIYMTSAIALHCAKKGLNIRCNAISPGIIDTPIMSEFYQALGGKDSALAVMGKEHVPVGRVGRPEEVAGLAAYLASDEADYVTGGSYSIDGGQAIG